MNQHQPNYLETQHAISSGQQYAPHPSTASNNINHYAAYQNQASPSVMSSGQYSQSPTGYPSQYYGGGMASPHGSGHNIPNPLGQVNPGLPPLPTMQAAQSTHYGGTSNGNAHPNYPPPTDPSGQTAPPGMKPRVTATLWEDEGCMCFQVETKGVCVARRDDNHMINGTKLLNVAGMTRGRRDGILKSEKTRHVVKIGPMHLKGVWIPFERALDFANKEKITESLYPLFVHNIGALLYHPTNSNRSSQVMAAQQTDRRRPDKLQGGVQSASQPPALTHHHTMNSTTNAQQSASIAANASAGRPGLDRAHTFPTPPTSASGTMTSIGSQPGSYDWTNNGNIGPVQSGQAVGMDNHSQSTPATPATTPPNTSLPSLQNYQGQPQMYGGQSGAQAQYPSQHGLTRTGSVSAGIYPKHEMGPPSRVAASRPESEHGDVKLDPYGQPQHADNAQGGGDAEADAEQDADYNGNAQAYGSHRGSFDAYNSNYANDNPHIGQDAVVNGGSGRGTPRTSQQWAAGYQNSPRAPPSSNLYNPTSDARGSLTNGNPGSEGFVSGAYAPTQQVNGVKRQRDDDDTDGMKRQKMSIGTNNSLINGTYEGERPINRARPSVAKATRAR